LPRYVVDVPEQATDEYFIEPRAVNGNGESNDNDLRSPTLALLGTRGLSDATRADYTKKVMHSWQPYCAQTGTPLIWPSVVDVCQWLVWLSSRGTRSPATIRQYLLSRAKLQPIADEEGNNRPNPFHDPSVRTVLRALRNRLTLADDSPFADTVRRAPLPPTYAHQVAQFASATLAAMFGALSSHTGDAASVGQEHLLAVRDSLAVLVGFTFGFRASHLYELRVEDFDWIDEDFDEAMPTNCAWRTIDLESTLSDRTLHASLNPGQSDAHRLCVRQRSSKTQTPHDARRDGGRTMRDCEWMRQLRGMLRQYVQVRQWWHSLRIDHDLFARTGAVRPVTVKSEWSLTASSASEWELRRTMLRPSQMTPEIFLMPFERPVDDRKRRPAIVQHWLDNALRSSRCPAPPQGLKFTTHSMRSGGASSAWLVTRNMPIIRWWFRWSDNSNVPERCYLAIEWNQLVDEYKTAAQFFFGWLNYYEFTNTRR
jgi:hypothetical protein